MDMKAATINAKILSKNLADMTPFSKEYWTNKKRVIVNSSMDRPRTFRNLNFGVDDRGGSNRGSQFSPNNFDAHTSNTQYVQRIDQDRVYFPDLNADNNDFGGWRRQLPKAPLIKQCKWIPPSKQFIKMNIYAVSKGNPGPTGLGAILRDHKNKILGCTCHGLQEMNSYTAEGWGIVIGAEMAVQQGWKLLWIESDSTVVVQSFGNKKMPWQMEVRWIKTLATLEHVVIASTWREVK
ncbi:hypothetical protein FRX31_028279 [Thalictrum thalictroides]|uniref:RNase H type-1 domain-containing protein n=1 Tax=Thalictrum thalictroides TaxID=46969 RepID=A0A7J6VAM1_THATH|nr:hypothetical protein FRX31_028279 [Thalictrum thalictroides]